MRTLSIFTCCCLVAVLFLLGNGVVYAQDTNISGDTTKVNVPKLKSPFGLMDVPTELMNTEFAPSTPIYPKFTKAELYKDYTEEYRKYGLNRPTVNLHLNYYNPKQSFHPALYALLILGAFFNNRVLTVPEEQYQKIMNDLYGHSPYSSSSRYDVAQFNITRGVFGNPNIEISGYKVAKPDLNNYNNIIPENKPPKPTNR